MPTLTPQVITGAIALIKVNGNVVGKMRNVRIQETIQRQDVRGLGTILTSEAPVVTWNGTISCSFMAITFAGDGIPGAINRNFNNANSLALSGGTSFEDQLVLDDYGVEIDVFKKVSDVIDGNGIIKPKLVPICVVQQCLIESDSFEISEGGLAGHDQSFRYLVPILNQV